jgi:uncharacterized protein (TIGR00730 family)
MIVTVFGASQTQPGDSLYQDALLLGNLLAEAGFSIATGGYIGTMEAVSRGASEAGGHVIGITCEEIENWRKVGANPWVVEERKQLTLIQRLDVLISTCDAAMALPGGVGTLAEILVMWNRLIVKSISPRPLVLIGQGWKETMSIFLNEQGNYISEVDKNWLHFADSIPQAVSLLKTLLEKQD